MKLHPSLPSLIFWKSEKGGETARSQRVRRAPLPDLNGVVVRHDARTQRLRTICKEQRWSGPFGFVQKDSPPSEKSGGN